MIDVPASASPHVARAITTARNLIAGATSANTRRSYETGWRQFTAHAQGLGLKGGCRAPKRTRTAMSLPCRKESGVVAGEVAGQRAVGVRLGDEIVCLLHNGRHGVGTSREAQRRLALACELDQRLSELCGVTSLLAVHAVPGSDGLLGARGVVVKSRTWRSSSTRA